MKTKVSEESFSPTMNLRWKKVLEWDEGSHDVILAWGKHVILQQRWQGSKGNSKWENIKFEA